MRQRGMAVGGLLIEFSQAAHAGMTTYDLNDVVRLRLEDISFFALLLLASALGIRLLWNHVTKGLPVFPRLTYGRALCLTGLLSLLSRLPLLEGWAEWGL